MTESTGMAPHGFVRARSEGAGVWHLGALWTFKIGKDQTNGLFCLAEQLLPEGFAPPVHRHSREDEAWILLDGEVTFFLGDHQVLATEGSYVYGPRNLAHTFLVESATARLATFITPGAVEDFFHETGHVASSLVLPPPPDSPPDLDGLLAKMRAYGVEFVAPPPEREAHRR